MKPGFTERFWSTAVIAIMACVLIALAVLQYRWSGEISDAAMVRMKQNLQASIVSFRDDLMRELSSTGRSLQPAHSLTSPSDLHEYALQVASWRRGANHPWLVDNIYVWRSTSSGTWQTWKLDPARGQFVESETPAKLSRLQLGLETLHRNRFFGGGRPFPPGEAREGPHPPRPEHERGEGAPWVILDQIPAMIHSIPRPPEQRGPRDDREWVVVELSSTVLEQHIFPELAERYFGGGSDSIYRVTITSSDMGAVLYSSVGKSSTQEPLEKADANVNLFGPMGPFYRESGGQQEHRLNGQPGPPRFPDRFRGGIMHFDLLSGTPGGDGWRIIVNHRNGSLEAAVHSLRERNLLISFGVLLILGITTGVLVLFTHRTQRLARLQMEFVTGVSHELRTPLTVISSAAENLADGIIEQKQVARYGSVIKTQANQLTGLVEQILLFASTRDKRHQYQIRQLSAKEIIDAALQSSAGLLQSHGIAIDQDYSNNLPHVKGDLNALSQCLQNLITNAVKYRGLENWIGITAQSEDKELQISVEDHGQGISSGDLGHIFEPFFRGREVTEAQIHGTGLGLPIARNIAQAMGGRLSVESKVGQGSKFTLHLPIVPNGIVETESEVESPVRIDPRVEQHQ